MSPLRLRLTRRLGPLAVSVTQRGRAAVSVRLGRFSYALRSGRLSVNLLGPLSWVSGIRRRRD